MRPFGDLHRVDVADQVADAGVGGGELLAVALAAVLPADREVVTDLGVQPLAAGAHRRVGVVVDLAAVDDRGPLVEQRDEGADEARLALAALAEEYEVVSGKQGALQGRQHGRVEADDAGEAGLAAAHLGEEVLADLGAHGAVLVSGGAQGAEGGRSIRMCHSSTVRRAVGR